MPIKLNQVIAVEKGIKSRVTADVDALYKAVQKPALFEGMVKKYQKKSEDDGEDVPGQRTVIQAGVSQVLAQVQVRLADLFDVSAQKDFANCEAKATVEVDGEALIVDAPATYLLFLEKQLTDLNTFVEKLPVLDAAEEWTWDAEQGVFRTKAALTSRTKKVQKPLVLYPATPEHPAQTQIITEDIIAGTWETTRYSTAIPNTRKAVLIARVQKLHHAVKFAREQANMVDAPKKEVGGKILGWIFAQ